MSYTVNDLEMMNTLLSGPDGVNKLIKRLGDYETAKFFSELIDSKIQSENKNRKKRAIKFIDYYSKKYKKQLKTVNELIDLTEKQDDFKGMVQACFASRDGITHDMIAFYARDLTEYFKLFALNTSISEIERLSK